MLKIKKITTKGDKSNIQNAIADWVANNTIHLIHRIEYIDTSIVELVPDSETSKLESTLKKQLQDYEQAHSQLWHEQKKLEQKWWYRLKLIMSPEILSTSYYDLSSIFFKKLEIENKLKNLKHEKQHKTECWQANIYYKELLK